jgi:hypothetical protein
MSAVCLRCDHYDYEHQPRADIQGGWDGLSFADVDPDDDTCTAPGCGCWGFDDDLDGVIE